MKKKACSIKFTNALGFHGKSYYGWQPNSLLEWSINTNLYNHFVESIRGELTGNKERPRVVIYGAGFFGQVATNIIEGNHLAEIVAIVDQDKSRQKDFAGYKYYSDINDVRVDLQIDYIFIATSPVWFNEISNILLSSKNSSFSNETEILFMFDDYINIPPPSRDETDITSKIVVSSLMKSGTHWLNNMLHPILTTIYHFECIFNPVIPAFHQVFALENNQYTYGHFATDEISYFINFPDYKFIFLYRDLRDQITSLYLFHKYRNHPEHPHSITLNEIQKYFEKYTDEESLNLHIKGVKTANFHVPSVSESVQYIRKWMRCLETHSNIHVLTYEKLVNNPLHAMKDILLFLNMDVDRKVLEEVIEKASFEKMSGGRSVGAEDLTSHQRKGVIGDWKNHFTDRHKILFKTEVADFLIETGYETDDNW